MRKSSRPSRRWQGEAILRNDQGVRPLFGLVFALLMVSAIPAESQWAENASVNTPVCVAPNDQEFPGAVTDGAGGVIIAWSDKRASTSNADVYAQRLDANGFPLWGPCGVPVCLEPGTQDGVAMVADGEGGAMIFWVDRRSGDADIYGQRISATGGLLWNPTGIAVTQVPGVQSEIRAVADGSGGSVLAWRDLRSDGGDVYAQRVSGAGVPLWTPNGFAVCGAAGPQYDVALAGDDDGGLFLAWADERTGDADVYVQRVSSSGVAAWTANGVPVVALAEQHYRPVIIRDGVDGAIVAWVDWRSTDTELYAQRISGAGTPLWAANGVYVNEVTQNQFDLKSDGEGGALIACTRGDGISLKVYASRLRPDGTSAWTPPASLISTAAPIDLTLPLRMLPDGAGAMVVWQDSRQPPGSDLYAQRFDSTGTPLWDSAGIAVATAYSFQSEQRLVSDGRGGAIVVFQDNRGALDEDIYAQRVRPDGSRAPTTSLSVRTGWNLLTLPRVTSVSHVDSIFPGNQASFFFDGAGYLPADTLAPGTGMWVRFPSPASFEVEGSSLDSIALSVPQGNTWTLVGGLTEPVPATALISDPPGAVQAGPYRFDGNGYVRTTMFRPGEACWVFVTQPCILTLRRP